MSSTQSKPASICVTASSGERAYHCALQHKRNQPGAAVELGVLFCTIVLLSGPIWAKPVWGVYWQWDSRLTTTFILWLIYVGYLVVRSMAPDRATGARWVIAAPKTPSPERNGPSERFGASLASSLMRRWVPASFCQRSTAV